MPKIINLNDNWIFEGKEIRIPHTVKEIPFNYFDEKMYQGIFDYDLDFEVEKDDLNKNVFLCFDGIGHSSKIYLNDQLIEEHLGGYDSFKINVTNKLKEKNHLKVVVNSNENQNIPPFGKVVDYLTYGGIYREVYLEIKDEKYLDDIFFKPRHIDNKWYIEIDLKINKETNLQLHIFDDKNDMIIDDHIFVDNNKTIKYEIINPLLWDLDNPHLYSCIIQIGNDVYNHKFGLRTVYFKNDGFYLNDKKIKLLGLNRHQSYPYVGYAATKRMQEQDAYILKNELGVNCVRTSHYMQSKHFLNKCDELGLLVFTETPGWQHLGNQEWKDLVIKNIKAMFDMNKNHPSVFLYGARINESVDDHDLYMKTNELLHQLDDTRPTGGVRCYPKGEELEDVYTYNDFINPMEIRGLARKKDIVKSQDMPYFVSEFNGHMYPTKNYDDSVHQEEHLRRLSKGINECYKDDEILGLFTWCMFDYNTHKEFGSGDKICYHGVLDMFRNPKVASYVFSSQRKDDFMAISNLRLRGDWPACAVQNPAILTNLDSVKLYKNNQFIKEFNHQNSKYKYIPNTPILIDDFIGNQLEVSEGYSKKVSERMKDVLQAFLRYGSKMPLNYKLKYLNLILFHHLTFEKGYQLYTKYFENWGDEESIYRFEGIKDGKVVKTIILEDAKKLHLEIKCDTKTLHDEDTYDVASIRIMVKDQNNNIVPYYNEPFELINDDLLDIIGPKLLSFKGGFSGTYLKTKKKKGISKLIIKTPFETKEIEFSVNP